MTKKKLTDNMAEYKKEYRLKNPEKFTTEIKCDICDGKYQICSKNQHLKTLKHKMGEKLKYKDCLIDELANKLKNLKSKQP